ncbi:bacteriorhodopsin [Micromonospora sp. NPDC050795]|uniref:bacteriorhodopsin n=1 Tax=Micromonospora sp. NPDC050795 TaxID=3364282 RepID=UPI0037897655
MEFWLWFYVAAMAAGVVLFGFWRANPKGIPPIEYAIAVAIPLWSGFWYLVMALGGGRADVGDQTTFWARYADWVITTPLLLVALSLTAMQALPNKRWGLVRALVAADILMITMGFLADVMENRAARYSLYAVGVVALLVVFGLIWGPLRATAARQPAPMSRTFTQVALLLSVLWVGYPLIWILGPSGLELFGNTTDTALFVILPILSKVGWSAVDLGLLRRLSDRRLLTVA